MISLESFIHQYDKPHTIILLEGKRVVSLSDQKKLSALGRMLAERTMHMLFRSGNAQGSDHLFSLGVASVNPGRLQVITPYRGHRKNDNQALHTISLDDVDLANEPQVIMHTRNNPRIKPLIDSYLNMGKNSYTVKARYLFRDTIKVVGTSKIAPASFAIFYDDLQKPKSGGTGHTMHVCEQNGIPQINQQIWFEWLKQ